jgi:hypothetical protein
LTRAGGADQVKGVPSEVSEPDEQGRDQQALAALFYRPHANSPQTCPRRTTKLTSSTPRRRP